VNAKDLMMYRTTRSCALVGAAALLLLAQPLSAQDSVEDTDASVTTIDTVTIIGRQSDVADIPGSAHVLGAEELGVFIQTDIMRVLRAVPGVYVQEEEGFGLRPNIGIRGSGIDRSARIALLEDGVLIAPAPYAAPSAYYFPTQRRMTSLEVLKGPASIVVGPRTTGGAINMISTPIPETAGGVIDVRLGQHQTRDMLLNFGASGERISWLLETVQAASDGFKIIDGPVGGDTGYDIQDYIGKLQIDSDPSAGLYQSLRFKLGYTEQESEETYLGLIDEDFVLDPNRRYAASAGDIFVSEHEQFQVSYVIDPGNNWSGEITAYRNNFARSWYKLQAVEGTSIGSVLDDPDTYATELGYLKGVTSPDDAISKRANNRSYYSQGIQARIDWGFGFGETDVAITTGIRVHEDEEDRFQHEDDYRMEEGALVLTTAGAPGTKTNRVSSADVISAFVDTEFRTGDWIFTPGIRFENVEMQRLDYSTTNTDRDEGPTRVRTTSLSEWIPGMGALYRLNEEWRLLAGIHKGFNPPAPGSVAKDESSTNIEIGTRYKSDELSFEAIYFVNDYDNLVGTVSESTGGGGEVGDQYDGGKVKVTGLELNADRGWDVGDLYIPLGLRYTWTNEAQFNSSFDSGYDPWGSVEAGDELPYIPEHQWRLSAGLEATQWRVNIAASYIGALRTKAGQGALDPHDSIDSHIVMDFIAAWEFTSKLSSYLKVDNLLDETYIAARRPAGVRPGLPRTAYLGLTYQL
jgi:Fe(3+) dicitrate transport protein